LPHACAGCPEALQDQSAGVIRAAAGGGQCRQRTRPPLWPRRAQALCGGERSRSPRGHQMWCCCAPACCCGAVFLLAAFVGTANAMNYRVDSYGRGDDTCSTESLSGGVGEVYSTGVLAVCEPSNMSPFVRCAALRAVRHAPCLRGRGASLVHTGVCG